MVRQKSFLDASLRMDGIIHVVQMTKKKPKMWTKLRDESKIKFKQSLLKYLRYCVEMKFVSSKDGEKYKIMHGYGHTYKQKVYIMNYFITAKGKRFLELVK